MRHLTKTPKIDETCFIAKSADIIGEVRVGKNSSIWFGCVLRGDVMPIDIGDNTNVQDGTVIHGSINKAQTKLGNNITVGHKALLHGCTVEDNSLIGMGSIVMDNAIIPKNSMVAAGSLVTENSTFEEGMLIMGSPAKARRPLKEGELAWLKSNINHYVEYAKSYKLNEVKYYEHK